jgi:alpha-galactosidase
VRDLCVNPGLHGSQVTFMDIDEHRLDNISRMAQRLSSELNAGLTFVKTLDRRRALEGADFVINTAQVGGHAWTEAQRELGEKHGYYRGAHLHDFGQIAFFLDVARDIEQVCPSAWLIQSGNPVFEGCTLMTRETRVKVLGLCHGHYGYREIADVLGLDPKDVSAQMPGFNHFIWLTEFRYQGKDAYPLIDAWIRDSAETYWAEHRPVFYDNQMSRAAIDQYRLFGLMPIGDTPRLVDNPRLIGWWYHTDLETKKRWYGHLGGFDSEIGWNQYLEIMGENVQRIERAALDETQPITATFEAKQSEEQIVPIIHSMVNDQPGIYQVNIPNRGPILPGFPEDLVVECQGVVDGSGIRGISVPALPKRLVAGAMIPRWQRAEMVVEAVRSRDLNLVRLVLLYDPRTRSTEQADALIRDWLGDPRNQKLADLFQFHPGGAG